MKCPDYLPKRGGFNGYPPGEGPTSWRRPRNYGRIISGDASARSIRALRGRDRVPLVFCEDVPTGLPSTSPCPLGRMKGHMSCSSSLYYAHIVASFYYAFRFAQKKIGNSAALKKISKNNKMFALYKSLAVVWQRHTGFVIRWLRWPFLKIVEPIQAVSLNYPFPFK